MQETLVPNKVFILLVMYLKLHRRALKGQNVMSICPEYLTGFWNIYIAENMHYVRQKTQIKQGFEW